MRIFGEGGHRAWECRGRWSQAGRKWGSTAYQVRSQGLELPWALLWEEAERCTVYHRGGAEGVGEMFPHPLRVQRQVSMPRAPLRSQVSGRCPAGAQPSVSHVLWCPRNLARLPTQAPWRRPRGCLPLFLPGPQVDRRGPVCAPQSVNCCGSVTGNASCA